MTDRRTYDDSCGTALALDLIGERWAMLVMRELLLGPRRFGELRHGLPGISANVLTQRLETLEAVGVIVRRKLPPPASVQVYELTDWGKEAEPLILGLGKWAVRSTLHNPDAPLSAVGMMLSFKTMFVSALAGGLTITVHLKLPGDAYWMKIHDGKMTQGRGEVDGADIVIKGDPGAIAGVVHGLADASEMEASGAIQLEHGRDLLSRLSGLFDMPPKVNSLDAAP
jgi:DNA-binding HxlR family transcriptional regulator